jgi:lactoylglutathione lyase
MQYLHTMVRISNVEESMDFYCNKLGMVEVRRSESEAGRYTNIFLCSPDDVPTAEAKDWAPTLEPPKEGRMAFVRSPDGVSIELLQKGGALEKAEPWVSMGNTGVW